ncbi:hypothetical protein ACVNPX_02260 [Staphylococcus aureus]
MNNAHDLNQKQKDALKTQVNNAQRVSMQITFNTLQLN